MSDEDQASTETNTSEEPTEKTSEGNPFVADQKTEGAPDLKEKPQEKPVVGNTDDSINASLDEIVDPTVLKSMVTRLRHENGNHRKQKGELASEVETLRAKTVTYNQKLKEAEERVAQAELVAKTFVIKAAAVEYDVDEDLIDLIDGKTTEEIYEKASRLQETKKRKPAYETPTRVDLFPGRTRGKAVKPAEKDSGGEFFRDFMGQ